jgi:hypothetical protein
MTSLCFQKFTLVTRRALSGAAGFLPEHFGGQPFNGIEDSTMPDTG